MYNLKKLLEQIPRSWFHLLFPLGVLLLQLLQHVDLQLGSFPVFIHVLDDLQRQHLVPAISDGHHKLHSVTYELISLTLTTLPKVPSPRVARILSA